MEKWLLDKCMSQTARILVWTTEMDLRLALNGLTVSWASILLQWQMSTPSPVIINIHQTFKISMKLASIFSMCAKTWEYFKYSPGNEQSSSNVLWLMLDNNMARYRIHQPMNKRGKISHSSAHEQTLVPCIFWSNANEWAGTHHVPIIFSIPQLARKWQRISCWIQQNGNIWSVLCRWPRK